MQKEGPKCSNFSRNNSHPLWHSRSLVIHVFQSCVQHFGRLFHSHRRGCRDQLFDWNERLCKSLAASSICLCVYNPWRSKSYHIDRLRKELFFNHGQKMIDTSLLDPHGHHPDCYPHLLVQGLCHWESNWIAWAYVGPSD